MKNDIDDFNTSVGEEISAGWDWFYQYCSEKEIDLAIYLHATTDEIDAGEYDKNGKWIMSFAADKDIPLYTDIGVCKKSDYVDDCHLNADGQKVIFQILEPVIGEIINKEGAER